MAEIKTILANKSNYGNRRDVSNIKYIVIHYTANDGDTAENNGNYFKNNVVKASSHYFVDDDSIVCSVPEDYTAYHCGASKYKHSKCRNANSIGIELCDSVKNGVIYPSTKTILNALALVESLMAKYNIPKGNIIRHYDVVDKKCPAYWCGSEENDAKWASEFWDKIGKVNNSDDGYLVKITASALNIRAGASTEHRIVGCIRDRGTYTIVEESNGRGATKWGKLKSVAGWISLDYTTKL